MKLKFLGTRGEIEARSKRHGMHSSLLIVDTRTVMIDCGEDWIGRVSQLQPNTILLTHAHPDHVGGLKKGSPCPVFASMETWKILKRYPIQQKQVIVPGREFEIGQVAFEAFPVEHSVRAPAIGLRIRSGPLAVIYVPDVAFIPDTSRVLAGTKVYIGDGATITRPLLRKRGRKLIGHAPVAQQLEWCETAGVRHAVFTHCGSQIVAGDEQGVTARLRALGQQHGVEAQLAYDGLEILL